MQQNFLKYFDISKLITQGLELKRCSFDTGRKNPQISLLARKFECTGTIKSKKSTETFELRKDVNTSISHHKSP